MAKRVWRDKLYTISKDEYSIYNEKDYEYNFNVVQSLLVGKNNKLRLGVLYNHWVSPEGKRFYYGNRCDVHTVSSVLVNEFKVKDFNFDAGIKMINEFYTEYGAYNIEGSSSQFKGVAPILNQWQPVRLELSVGSTYALSPRISAHLNISGGSISPRTSTLTAESTIPLNEKRILIDVGIMKSFENNSKLKITSFYVKRIDAVEYDGETLELYDGSIIALYENVNQYNYGIESEFRYNKLFSCITPFANIMLNKAKVESNDGNFIIDDEVPSFIGNIGSTFELSGFEFNIYCNYTGRYYNDRFVSNDYLTEYGKAPLGDFVDIDIIAAYNLGDKYKIRIFGEIRNLLNKKYSTVAGYHDFGRRIAFGLRMKI